MLPAFSPFLSAHAEQSLRDLGVDVRTDAKVTRIDHEGVEIDGGSIAARTTFWAAGVAASPAAKWLGQAGDKSGRVVVDDDLSVRGCPGIFAIGDTSASNGWAGAGVPGLAPAAKQQGRHVARVIGQQSGASAAKCLPVPALRQSCDDWTPRRGCGGAPASVVGGARVVAVGSCPCVVTRRRTQPHNRGAELALGLPDLPAGHPPYHPEYDGRLSH